MSNYPTTYPNESSERFSSYSSHLHPSLEDQKASFDDLIDEYASPYAVNAQHQTYNVGTPAMTTGGHRRGTSYPLSQKPPLSLKMSDDASDTTHLGYPPKTPVKEVDRRSFYQKILPESLACRFYVITVLIQTGIDLAIEGELLVRLHPQGEDDSQIAIRKMPVYLSIFVLAHVFQFVMAVDAVYARNTLQFISLTIFNALFLVYAVIQIGEIQNTASSNISPSTSGISKIPIDVLTTTIPIVIAIAELAYIALGWKIYHEFGWKVYKFLGADRRIKKMYASYQIFECLVKFDVFFWVGFSVQFIWLVLQSNDWEYYVTCAALPLSIVLLVEGHLAARHENKWMMATFMSGCVGALIYFVYKLVKVLLYKDTDQFRLIFKTLTVFSVIAIVLLLVTFVFAIIVMRNFDRGLKASMARKKNTMHGRYASQNVLGGRTASANPNRMSID